MFIKILFVCFLLCFQAAVTSVSFANAPLSSLSKAFAHGWYEDYVSLACSDNIIRLGSRLSDRQKSSSSVVHIFHKSVPYLAITPKRQRLSFQGRTLKPHSWTFHAILLNERTVFDYDYTEHPKPEDFSIYFEKMWEAGDLKQKYRFQIKPLSLYSPTDTDGTMDEILYPILTFQELKFCLENQTCP